MSFLDLSLGDYTTQHNVTETNWPPLYLYCASSPVVKLSRSGGQREAVGLSDNWAQIRFKPALTWFSVQR